MRGSKGFADNLGRSNVVIITYDNPSPRASPTPQDDDRHVVGLVLADLARRDWIAKAGKEAQADLWDGLHAIEHEGGKRQNDRTDPAKGG